jgi:tetratricopeptide (TPR) repeat protein
MLPMRLLLKGALVLVLLLLAAPRLSAATYEEAFQHFNEGDFKGAEAIGTSLGTCEGYALASTALSIRAYYLVKKGSRAPLYQRAIKNAEQAIEINPDHASGHVSAAIAMGRYSQDIGIIEAFSKGFAGRIKKALDRAIDLDPNNPLTYVTLGGWHAEVIKAAGIAYGSLWYGASKDRAIANFEKAVELAPELNVVYKEYAINLLRLDPNKYAKRVQRLLRRAIDLPATDAHALLVRREATRLLASFEGHARTADGKSE